MIAEDDDVPPARAGLGACMTDGPRVLFVVPGHDGIGMVFAKRQNEHLIALGLAGREHVIKSRRHPFRVVNEIVAIRRAAQAHGADVVHAHYGTATAFLCALAAKVPLVITYRGSDMLPNVTMSWPHWFVGYLLSQLASLRAAAVVCVSQQIANRLWWARGKATVIPSGVNTEVFRPLPRAECRSRLGWPEDEAVVLYCSANAGKRPALALRAVEQATALGHPSRPVPLSGNIPPSEIPHYMNGADCLLLTSQYEGSPNVVKEAIACGLPVVSVAVGDVVERLRGVDPSSVVDDTPEALGQALAEVLRDRRRSNGPSFAASFSLNATSELLLAVYREAARGRQSRRP